jgi:hypothetical protein
LCGVYGFSFGFGWARGDKGERWLDVLGLDGNRGGTATTSASDGSVGFWGKGEANSLGSVMSLEVHGAPPGNPRYSEIFRDMLGMGILCLLVGRYYI